MSQFDIIILFLVAILGLKGLMRGFVKEVCGLIALVGGIYLASSFAGEVSGLFKFVGASGTTGSVLGFLSIFLAVWVGITYLAALLSRGMTLSGLGSINNILGFAAGSMKLFVVLSVIVFAVSNIAFIKPKVLEYTKDSVLVSPMTAIGGVVMNLKPTDITPSNIVNAVQSEKNSK